MSATSDDDVTGEGRDFADDGTIAGNVRTLIENARTFAEAELAYQKSRVTYAGKQMRTILLMWALCAVFVVMTVMALVFGTILALAPILTAWGALAMVAGGLLGLAVLCGAVGLFCWAKMVRAIKGA